MASKTAVLAVRIVTDSRDGERGMARAAGGVAKFEKGVEGASRKATVGLAAIAAGATAAALAAEEVASANTRVDQVLTNMGVGEATARVLAYAESLERSLGVDEKVIKQTQAKLGTFKAVADSADEAGGAFDRATVASIDLAAAGFGSAEDNAVQLGKALQDPVKGLGSLAKAGVTFTKAEQKMIKAMVKANDVAAAQDVVLSAIESQVGGVAEATADSSAKIALSFGNIIEKLGAGLLPILDGLVPYVETFTDAMLENSDTILVGLGGLTAFLAVIVALNVAMKVFRAIQTAIRAAIIAWTAAQWLLNVAMSANPIGLIVLAIVAVIAVIAGLVIGIKKLFNENKAFRTFVLATWASIKKAAQVAWDFIKTAARVVTLAVRFHILAVKTIALAVWNAVSSAAVAAFRWIDRQVKIAILAVTLTIRALRTGAAIIWRNIRDRAVAAWRTLSDGAKRALDAILAPIHAIRAAFDAVIAVVLRVISAIRSISFPSPPGWMRQLGGGFSLFSMAGDDGLAAKSLTASESFATTQLVSPAVFAPSSGSAGFAGVGDGANVFNVTVNGAIDPVGTARTIENVLGKYMRRNGRRTVGQAVFA